MNINIILGFIINGGEISMIDICAQVVIGGYV
jgi:hypothetical protein